MAVSEAFRPNLGIEGLQRSLRLLSILESCHVSGLNPVAGETLHSIAYLADALSPVWGLPILDAQILKRATRPFFPPLQNDLDRLVGRGLIETMSVSFEDVIENDGWAIRSEYRLSPLALPVISAFQESKEGQLQYAFVREVTFAAAGLGPAGISDIGDVDASYSDPFTDVGGLIDIGVSGASGPRTADVARRFNELQRGTEFTRSQLVHLYVRHLYSRLRLA